MPDPELQVLERSDFPRLIEGLQHLGYRVVGPTVREGAIVYGDLRSESDLPIGWTDQQEAGRYRLVRRGDQALFGYNVGPHSWKKFLFPARTHLWSASAKDGSFEVQPAPDPEDRPLAFLGVRACELAALEVTDRVFTGGVVDPLYQHRRSRVLRIAVECGQSGATCFCVSMRTGPEVSHGFDLALTEVIKGDRHYFLVRVGSEAAHPLLSSLPLRRAREAEREARGEVVAVASHGQVRRMPTEGIRELMLGSLEHPRWQEVGQRCLACANCTLACPTCFCSTEEEVPALEGDRVERWRRWDSCFNSGFSQLHATSVRGSIPARYRQWITHKLATWYDQFGSSGCVGCGRCITWCPVGIDITEEVAALRTSPTRPPGQPPAEGVPRSAPKPESGGHP